MKLAFYAFINFRMIGIHAGIQGGHCAGELKTSESARRFTTAQELLAQEWLDNHKVFVFLHGGQSADLYAAFEKYSKTLSMYPSTIFREDPEAFGDDANAKGAVTAWGIVLPESVFAARWYQSQHLDRSGYYAVDVEENGYMLPYVWTEGTPQYDFLQYKSGMRLAY
jgi:hypothetical protein